MKLDCNIVQKIYVVNLKLRYCVIAFVVSSRASETFWQLWFQESMYTSETFFPIFTK